MKKLLAFLSIGLLCSLIFEVTAQWTPSGNNIYYNTGNVGIGTTSPGVWFPGKVLEVQDNRPILNLESTGILSTISFINSQVNPSTHIGEFHLNHLYDPSTPALSTLTFATYPAGNALAINASGHVGIGTTSPKTKFDIYHTGVYDTQEFFTGQDHILLSSTNPGNGNYFGGVSWTNGSRRRASIAAVMEHADADFVGLAFFTQGVDGPGPFYESMRIAHNGNVGIGTLTPGNKLEVNGKIRSKEVIVEATGWPDYVFAEDYDLPTLAEIEAFIKASKHLPGIPSAKQVEEQGQQVGEIQKQLLKKMEEMTLHMIELKKENETLTKRIEQLEKTNNK